MSATQLNKWINQNDWELDRIAKQVTIEKLVRDYYKQLMEINNVAKKEKRPLNSTETDMIIKITNAITALRRKYNLSAYHSVLRETLEWMMKADNEMAKQFGPLMLEFLKGKAQELNNDKSIG